VLRLPRKHRTGAHIHFRHHVHQRFGAQFAQHPLPIPRHRKLPRPVGLIDDLEHRELDRRIHRDIHRKLGADALVRMLKDAVPHSMPRDVRRAPPRRQRRGRPELSGLFVAYVQSLAGAVQDRVVTPGRKPELVGILNPGVRGAALGNDRSEIGIGQHIDPRRRRHKAGLKGDDVFAAVFGKAAQAVGKNRLALRERRGGIGGPGDDLDVFGAFIESLFHHPAQSRLDGVYQPRVASLAARKVDAHVERGWPPCRGSADPSGRTPG